MNLDLMKLDDVANLIDKGLVDTPSYIQQLATSYIERQQTASDIEQFANEYDDVEREVNVQYDAVDTLEDDIAHLLDKMDDDLFTISEAKSELESILTRVSEIRNGLCIDFPSFDLNY